MVGFARGVAGGAGRTPRLLRFAEGSGSGAASPLVAPEVGLLEPVAGTAADPAAILSGDPLWTVLTVTPLSVAVLGPPWYRVGRPLYYRQ